jgi:hypothetical protein
MGLRAIFNRGAPASSCVGGAAGALVTLLRGDPPLGHRIHSALSLFFG